MTPGVIDVLDAKDVTAEAVSWPERAKAALVHDAATYTFGCELLKGIKALRQKIGATFDPHIKRAFEAHRALVSEKRDAETPLTEAESILKRSLVAYDNQQELLRRAEERRLQELARVAEEARRLEEAAALELEAHAAANEELMAEAVEMIAQPVAAPVVVVPRSVPKVTGISYREVWKFRVVDANKVPREYMKVDEIKIGGVVRAMKGGTTIPGVEIYADKVASAGGR